MSDSDSDSDVSPFSCKRKRPRPLDDSSPDDQDSGSYPTTASAQSKQSSSTELLTPSSVKSDCSSSTGRLTPASVKSEHTTSRKLKLATPPGIKKLKMKEQSLPDPYELPGNFRPDVELALSNKQMTKETTKAFISRVAAHIFTYKKYPSQDEYVSVARAVIAKYPFMKSPTGRPIVSLDIQWYI